MTLHSRIPRIAAHLDETVDDALEEGAEAVADSARQRVPVDSGALRDAIHTERRTEGEWAVVAGDRDAFYGHMVEYGTTEMPAHPFLTPAFESHKVAITKRVAAALTRMAARGG